MLDKKELRCATEGCGHKLEFHMVEPKVRCRVSMCRCDKWRFNPEPDPQEALALPKDWKERALSYLQDRAIVIISPPDVSLSDLRLELIGAGLNPIGSRVRIIEAEVEDAG